MVKKRIQIVGKISSKVYYDNTLNNESVTVGFSQIEYSDMRAREIRKSWLTLRFPSRLARSAYKALKKGDYLMADGYFFPAMDTKKHNAEMSVLNFIKVDESSSFLPLLQRRKRRARQKSELFNLHA